MRVAVIGMGLIGGSVLRALAAAGHKVVGFDNDPATRGTARTASAEAPPSARWQIAPSVSAAVADAELCIVAVPLPALEIVLDELTGRGFGGLITDVTSVKVPVLELAEQYLGGSQRLAGFVGGHPMAGRETSGFTAADPRLFDGCAWVLGLEPGRTMLGDWLDLADLVTGLGARAVPATAADHDRAVAAISHVPHLVASAVAEQAAAPLAAALGAGSFRDGTRVAATRSELVAAMCGGNADAVRPVLDAVIDSLTAARDALDARNPIAALRPWLAPGHDVRSAWPPVAGEPLPMRPTVNALLDLGRAGGWITGVSKDRTTVTAVRPD
ncbi:prephenate dehydrogenase [Catenuloplanes japonicus]|uniref:prephenate dehydrogenase n=1 Tax=Catenuloplanes japonicus TaxID=33876 RepID=UPI0006903D8F|nr:prephenate dehydrogenase/arogenate dehydrogenase family protein [Catenuloplanes japonicus]